MMIKVVEMSIANDHNDPQTYEPIETMDVADEYWTYDNTETDRHHK